MTLLKRLLLVCALPANYTHETLHAVAAAPWAASLGVVVEPRPGRCRAQIQWAGEVGRLVRLWTALAPAVGGLVALSVAIATGLIGLAPPATVTELATLAVLAGYAALSFTPSVADLKQARGELDA